jgi:gluconolactonase
MPTRAPARTGGISWRAFCANRCSGGWRLALMASSSWSHSFLTEKNWQLWPDVPADRALYDALETGDYAKWHAYKTNQIEESGQHEVLNWFCLLGAMEALASRTRRCFSKTGPLCRLWSSRITMPSRRITDSEEINMPTLNDLIDGDAQRLDTGFTFTEGPLYHPNGFYYFVDVRESKFYRIKPGEKAELLRENTGEGNGTTFDPQGRLIQCEGGNRRVTRWPADGTFASSDVLMDRFDGKRLSRPNDVVCKSDGSVYFTNPGLRIPLGERELDPSAVYRIMPDGSNKHVADFEYPNGLAFSPDERVLYVANTRQAAYIHRIELDSAGNMVRRSIFADMSSDEKIGVPDGMKVDVQGNVYCTGPGGTWVYAADGTHIGTIKTPEVPANLAFGGPDMKTLFFTAHTSVYSMRVKVAGLPGHPFKKG